MIVSKPIISQSSYEEKAEGANMAAVICAHATAQATLLESSWSELGYNFFQWGRDVANR